MTKKRAAAGQTARRMHSAPRYDPQIIEAVRALDDRRLPMAETCRRIGTRAEACGLPRPSYVHIRRLIKAHRTRRDEVRELLEEIADDFARHRLIDAYEIAERVRDLSPGI